MLDSTLIRQDFPILSRKVHGKSLVYLDNAATSQKPRQVIDAITNYYKQHNANVHRGVHLLSDESTQVWEESRAVIAQFFGAQSQNLIMTRNTTEALNGIAYGWGLDNLSEGDVVLSTLMEHHSNLVVWQQVCKRTGARLQLVDLDHEGKISLSDLKNKLENARGKVRLLALVHVSNATGVVNPVEKIVQLVRAAEVSHPGTSTKLPTRIALDAAQSAPHLKLDFSKLGVDFLAFSGHKMLGPMGVGGLLVRSTLLEGGESAEFKPWLFGGGMIAQVHPGFTTFHDDPTERFTAGTPDVASTVGLAAACRYLEALGMQEVQQHDQALVAYALEQLSFVPEVAVIGPREVFSSEGALQRLGSVAFMYSGVHAHDVAQVLDSEGIAVRSGHHCTMPLHEHFRWQATTRVSFQVYNSMSDIDYLVIALNKVKSIFLS